MKFPPEVERWRSLVEKYFPPSEVERALWVIWQESEGDPSLPSQFNADGSEDSHGLWQINLDAHPHMRGKTNDPEAATAYAAQLWADQGWSPWSVTHNGFPEELASPSVTPPSTGDGGEFFWNKPQTASLGQGHPLDGPGYHFNPETGQFEYIEDFNKGWDFGMNPGDPVHTPVSGTVISVGNQGDGWGVSIKVRDSQGNIHNFGHLGNINVKEGDVIQPGQVIADIGAGGAAGEKSTGSHLSYDVWREGDPNSPNPGGRVYIDPGQFIEQGKSQLQNLPYTGQSQDMENLPYTGQEVTLEPMSSGPTSLDDPASEKVGPIIAEINASGPKRNRDQIALDEFGKSVFELTAEEYDQLKKLEAQEQAIRSYTLDDIRNMVKNGDLTPQEAATIFDNTFAKGLTPGFAAEVRKEILSLKVSETKVGQLTDADLVNLYVETGNKEYLDRLKQRHGSDSDSPWDIEKITHELEQAEERRQKFLETEAKKGQANRAAFATAFDPFGVGANTFADQVKPFSGTDIERDAMAMSGNEMALMQGFKRDNPDIPFSADLIDEWLGTSWSPTADPTREQNMSTFAATGGRFIYDDVTRYASGTPTDYQRAQSLYDITTRPVAPPPGNVAPGIDVPGTIMAPREAPPVQPPPTGPFGPGSPGFITPPPDRIMVGDPGDPGTRENQITPPSFSGSAGLKDPSTIPPGQVPITAPAFAGSGGYLPGARESGTQPFSQLPDGRYIDSEGNLLTTAINRPQETALNAFGQPVEVNTATRAFTPNERAIFDRFPDLFTGESSFRGQGQDVMGESAMIPQFSGIAFNPVDPTQGQRIADAIRAGGGLQGAYDLLQERDRVALSKVDLLANQGQMTEEEHAQFMSSNLDIAQGLGYNIEPSENGWVIVDSEGNVILGPFGSSAEAQSRLAIGMYHRTWAPNNTPFAAYGDRSFAQGGAFKYGTGNVTDRAGPTNPGGPSRNSSPRPPGPIPPPTPPFEPPVEPPPFQPELPKPRPALTPRTSQLLTEMAL